MSDSFSFGRITVIEAVSTRPKTPRRCHLKQQKDGRGQVGEATHVRPGAAQVDDLGAAVAVLLEARALVAVEGVADPFPAADDALILVVSEAALVADAHERRGPHVRVADGALAVALVAEAPDGDAGLLAAHDEIGVVAGHAGRFVVRLGGGVS